MVVTPDDYCSDRKKIRNLFIKDVHLWLYAFILIQLMAEKRSKIQF